MVCVGEKYKCIKSDKGLDLCPAMYTKGQIWEVTNGLPLELNLLDGDCSTNMYIRIGYDTLKRDFVKIKI